MGRLRGKRNAAREKVWPGEEKRILRELKRSQEYASGLSPTNEAKLLEHIAMPRWEERMLPLFLFRGTKPYRVRALQNVAYGMFLEEIETMGMATRIMFDPTGIGHACGLHAKLQNMALYGIFTRLRGAKKFTDSVSKAFTEYVEWVHPAPCTYFPVPFLSTRRGDHAWWRQDAPLKERIYLPRPDLLTYPYVREKRPEHDMLLQVHSMIPSRIQGDLRADLCQDMFVAVLSGEIQIGQIPESIKRYAQEARKIAPNRWRDVPLEFVDEDTPSSKSRSSIPIYRQTADFAPSLCDHISHLEEEVETPIVNWEQDGIVFHRSEEPRYKHDHIQSERDWDEQTENEHDAS